MDLHFFSLHFFSLHFFRMTLAVSITAACKMKPRVASAPAGLRLGHLTNEGVMVG